MIQVDPVYSGQGDEFILTDCTNDSIPFGPVRMCLECRVLLLCIPSLSHTQSHTLCTVPIRDL